jgi:asparagine synthase (glutamine-hydrolysing)
MCGISGWFSPDKLRPDSDSCLKRMINAISHRGPDGQGVFFSQHVALGHARLSVIDLEKGQQPMSLHGKIHIVFNGEIYNYQELRSMLIKKGHEFLTNSDTEVILALYAEFDTDAFTYLRGMFAIALWDDVKQRGILVRDTIGIKPLFYKVLTNGELIFASEAKSILAREERMQGDLDENAMHLLMNFRYLPGDLSLFKDVRQLAPGTIAQWTANKPLQSNHFEFRNRANQLSIIEELEDSCRLHMTADVEVGSYLSGGIDSACVTSLAARHASKKFRTYTLKVGDDPSEANNATRSAEILGLENIQGDVSHDMENQLLKLVWHLEVPKINALQISFLAKLASQKNKVVLSGLGGDELFLGYNAHKIMQQVGKLDGFLPNIAAQSISKSTRYCIGKFNYPVWSEPERAMLMLNSMGDWPRVYGLLRNVWDEPNLREKIYGPRLLDIKLDDAFDNLRDKWPKHSDSVTAAAEYEWHHKMVNDLLWQEDRCSMAYGLEVRVPFLDPVLARSVQKLSRQQLMPGGRLKGYMQDMLRGVLPEEIMRRPKSGFQVDAATFFSSQLNQLAEHWLSQSMVNEMQLFNPSFVKLVRSYPAGKAVRWHYFMLYLMIMAHMWVHMFEQGNQP